MKFIKKLVYLGLLVLLVFNSVEAVKAEQIETKENYFELDFVPGQIIVGIKPTSQISYSHIDRQLFPKLDLANVEILLSGNTESKSFSESIGTILLLTLTNDHEQAVFDAIQLLEEHPDVEYAEPDYLICLDSSFCTDEHITSNQYALGHNSITIPTHPLWNIERIAAPRAWNTTLGSTSVKVGVIDSGIDHTHPNISRNVDTTLGYDFVLNRPNASDVHNHGTHISGIIGAVGQNSSSVIGVAPEVTLVPLRVLNRLNVGQVSNVIRAINYANELNLDIINYSITGRYSHSLEASIRAFNGLVVVAAGNDNRNIDTLHVYPASLNIPNMITVGNSNDSDQRSSTSNFGRRTVDLFAPGNGIISTLRGNSFGNMSGTSMATPHVTGAAVLALSINPDLTPIDLKTAIMDSVDPIPALASLAVTGGRLNVEKLIEQLLEAQDPASSDGIEYNFRTEIHCAHPWNSKSGLEHCHNIHIADIIGFNGSQKNVLIPRVVENRGTRHTVRRITNNAFANKGLETLNFGQLTDVNHISSHAFEGNPLQRIIVPAGHANPDRPLFTALRNGMQGVTTNTILYEGTIPKYQWNGIDDWIPIK